eukprot:g10664.t1
MAGLLGESVGSTVGYRMRLDTKVSAATRIEVVTEGVFSRMILDDPELNGVSAVIFDEFHERSLDADFGLALALDAQSALRDDLRLLVMSATLDTDRIAALLGGPPVIQSKGRSFPVEIRYKEREGQERLEDAVLRAIEDAHRHETGSILAFLPGQAEILRIADRLRDRLGPSVLIAPLFGNLTQQEQDLAIRRAPNDGRKIVLATSIAETSITIDGVNVVIDSGFQRLPVYEAATGITRLETVRVSQASADQRAGRAGRTAPGVALRLWHPGQTAALPPFAPPQILASDLSALALDLAHWGVTDPGDLAFLDPPPAPAFAEARTLLRQLGALDPAGGLTAKGRLMRQLALPPRLAAMVIRAGEMGYSRQACQLAILLTEQGLGGTDVDLDERLRRFRSDRGDRAQGSRRLADRIAQSLPGKSQDKEASTGSLLLHAYPDRVALQRGGRGRFVMANGRGAELPATERLSSASMLVIADVTGRAAQARILAAAEVERSEVESELADAIQSAEECVFDPALRQVRARRVLRLGAVLLDERPLPKPKGDAAAHALAEGVGLLGLQSLPFSREGLQLRERLGFLHHTIGSPWPDVSDAALLDQLGTWFTPFQSDTTSLDAIAPGSLLQGLRALVPYALLHDLDRLAPTHFEAPTGQRHPISYDGEEPTLTIRVQELFGLKTHPAIAGGRLPLRLELTSPAHRPIQTTRDLPGFWSGSWKDVRADMRGRYPKHPWPEDPAEATLVRLRWLAVAGQSVTVVLVWTLFGFSLPLAEATILIGALAIANIILSAWFPATHRLGPKSALALLAFDLLQMAALLFITGGLGNPFAPLICVPVIIAFASQPLRHSLALLVFALACTTALSLSPYEVPWYEGEHLRIQPVMQLGVWCSIASMMAFAAFYAYRVSHEASLLADALAATELVLEREKHLSQLDGLAAAAAHELGTPLATISVVAKEMERELGQDDRFREDVQLLRSQSERCRDILRRLTSLPAEGEEHLRRLPLSSLMEEVIAPHRQFGIDIKLVQSSDGGQEPVGTRNAAIIYGLGNLIENAVDYARRQVIVSVEFDDQRVVITLEDDGPGYAPEILSRIGEPYMTTRSREDSERAGGLGLGLFIAKTLLERSGASLRFGNRDPGEAGARIRIEWARSMMERAI